VLASYLYHNVDNDDDDDDDDDYYFCYFLVPASRKPAG